jgi:hypothetical protein
MNRKPARYVGLASILGPPEEGDFQSIFPCYQRMLRLVTHDRICITGRRHRVCAFGICAASSDAQTTLADECRGQESDDRRHMVAAALNA